MMERDFTRIYKGVRIRFEHRNGPHGQRWDAHFSGAEKAYATGILDSVPGGLVTLWRMAKRDIDRHLAETGYVP